MEKILSVLSDFHLAFVGNRAFCDADIVPNTIEAINKGGFSLIPASVPGNVELDMMKAGLIDFDPYFGTNIFKMQRYENLHAIYYTHFDKPASPAVLCFDGVDTVADLYINGTLVKHTENMYVGFEIPLGGIPLRDKDNELIVHIKPAMIEARRYDIPFSCNSLDYGYDSLYIRKAAHMYGWDIMPRIVSCGIWKRVYIKERKPDRLKEVYVYTVNADAKSGYATVGVFYNAELYGDFVQDYEIGVRGVCNDSVFENRARLYSHGGFLKTGVSNAKLWWPRYHGEPSLYDVEVTLYYEGKAVDTYKVRTGIRTVALSRTDTTDENGNGDFCFIVNGKRIFAMGSNWVPLDPFHSRDESRLHAAFDLLYDIGSNITRCWGGNVYESDEFYSLCDEHGIMVWQDFAMGCSVYPQDEHFQNVLRDEATYIVKRLRNHASIVLWAGDNECDYAYASWSGIERNPERNLLTRKVLSEVCEYHDYTRPYLASSPYITERAAHEHLPTSEDHLWGPRDYFKGNYYRNTVCHFASETGYHGCPSPSTMKKIIPEHDLYPWFGEDGNARPSWLAHAACMEDRPDAPFSYRIKLMADQVKTLFGKEPDNLYDFARASQVSQAEAFKYYIERFRLSKPRRTGIIWWNIVDGWPQISDAVVDYYYTKKLAYHYIKRSQNPVCLMFDEPKDGKIDLYAANELEKDVHLSYTVKRLPDGKPVLSGSVTAFADRSYVIDRLSIEPDEKNFYLIEWKIDGEETTHKNHYFTNILDIDYKAYLHCLSLCGMDEFEGFSDGAL